MVLLKDLFFSRKVPEQLHTVSVDVTPWETSSELPYDIRRSYSFKGLAGPTGHAGLEIICRLTRAKDAPLGVASSIRFVITPCIVEQPGFLVAQFAPSDEALEYKFISMKVEVITPNANLLHVEDGADTDLCMKVLAMGRQISLLLFAEKQQLGKLLLENDAGFVQKFSQLKRQILSQEA